MQIVRRLYLYALSFISLETVLWGTIVLARSSLANQPGGSTLQLARSLSLILIGAPVFLFHWRLVQRSSQADSQERSSWLRPVFLFGTLVATLIPVAQNALALINRGLLIAFRLDARQTLLGKSQTMSDNAIALVLNALVAVYFLSVLRNDWPFSTSQVQPEEPTALPGEAYVEVRRFYRYFWLIYGLGMVVFGTQQLLAFSLSLVSALGNAGNALFAKSLALLFVGTPILYVEERILRRSLSQSSERYSSLRLIVLYFMTFISLAGGLATAALVLEVVFNVLLGARPTIAGFVNQITYPISIGIPMGAVWAYYGRELNAEVNGFWRRTRPLDKIANDERTRSQFANLQRLYAYLLSLLGLAAAFIGLEQLLGFILGNNSQTGVSWDLALRIQPGLALALVIIGTPVWILSWRPIVAETTSEGESGDRARRSVIRKSYLFLVMFLAVAGLTASAGILLFQAFRALLGEPPNDLLLIILQQLKLVILFGLLLAYHWLVVRADGRLAERSLARRHAQFPVLILTGGNIVQSQNGEQAPKSETSAGTEFASVVIDALQKLAPGMPVAVHAASEGVPDETLSAARAVIVPAELIARPSESIRLWLQAYGGKRVVVPTPTQDWHWVFGSDKPLAALAQQAAHTVRNLAEERSSGQK